MKTKNVFLILIVYFILAPLAIWSINLEVPPAVETGLSIFAAPAAFAALPWIPVLQPLGLTEGEWIRLPTLLGWVFVSLFYSFGIAGAHYLIVRSIRMRHDSH